MILSNLHDIQIARSDSSAKRAHVSVDHYEDNQFISIIIPAHDEERAIKRCLDSILALNYPRFEVIIVNDGSKDNTHAHSLGYLWEHYTDKEISAIGHKTPDIKYYQLPYNAGKAKALNAGLLLAKGEIVVCMDADATFKSDALLRAAHYFKDPKVSVLAVNNKLVSKKARPLYILQHFDFIGNYRSKKAYDILNAEYIVSGIGGMYRRRDLLSIGGFPADTMTEDIDTSLMIVLLGNKNHRVRYAEDVITYMEPVHTFKDLLKQRYRWKFGNLQALYKNKEYIKSDGDHSSWLVYWRLPMAIISELTIIVEIMFFSYMFYVSVILGNGLFLVASYVVATLLSALTFFADDTTSKADRRALLRYLPVLYFLSLLMNAVQLWAFVKSVANIRSIKNRADGYAWVSPGRMGTPLHK
jgi:cellulose synthase/poly-beta-1,6-N-acetylglucosamine synthase-like glycosyltransferase